MIRFSHTVFALPFAMLAAVMAWWSPSPTGNPVPFRWTQLVGILACMVFARSAAMAFNRLADREFDAANPRTAARHLVTGELSVRSVRWFLLGSSIAFVVSTTCFLPNIWPLILSLPVLAFLCAYSYAKRFTALAHFWLGSALMLSPLCSWIAIRGQFLTSHPWDLLPSAVLGATVLLWVAGFDIIYACQDESFDRRAKLKSIPVQLGTAGALRLSGFCHFVMVLLLAAFPWICPDLRLGWVYGCGIGLVAALLTYEHSLVRPDELRRVNVAFFQVNAVVSLGLFLIVTIDLLT